MQIAFGAPNTWFASKFPGSAIHLSVESPFRPCDSDLADFLQEHAMAVSRQLGRSEAPSRWPSFGSLSGAERLPGDFGDAHASGGMRRGHNEWLQAIENSRRSEICVRTILFCRGEQCNR